MRYGVSPRVMTTDDWLGALCSWCGWPNCIPERNNPVPRGCSVSLPSRTYPSHMAFAGGWSRSNMSPLWLGNIRVWYINVVAGEANRFLFATVSEKQMYYNSRCFLAQTCVDLLLVWISLSVQSTSTFTFNPIGILFYLPAVLLYEDHSICRYNVGYCQEILIVVLTHILH